jgi:hypothetical protein
MVITDKNDLIRWAGELAGEVADETFAAALADRLLDRAHDAGIYFGQDWSSVVDLPEPEWLALLDDAGGTDA